MDVAVSGANRSRARIGLRAGLVLVVLATTVTAVAVVHARSKEPAQWRTTAGSPGAFVELTGVRIVRVALSGNGGLVDLRFQAVDAEKALVVHDANQPIRIVEEASGVVISTPFHGHGGGRLVQGVTYYQLFNNTGGAIRRGGLVSLIVGGVRLQHVRVQ
jgi:hypothetical protein